MAPAFVTGPAAPSLSAFRGAALPVCRLRAPSATAAAAAAARMSAAPVSRRQALSAAAAVLAGAALAPLAALAKGGDAPKISVFGVGGASSPFQAGIQQGGKVVYRTFNDDEVAVFKRIVSESYDRLEGAGPSIKGKSWEDIRSRIRLEASDLRKTQLTVNANLADKQKMAAAAKAYTLFKEDLENLDAACVQKNQDKAYKAYNSALKSLNAWQLAVGF